MRIRKLLILSTIGIMCLTGCSKTAKDTLYDTDLYGTYIRELWSEDNEYKRKTLYTFKSNDTYEYSDSEKINGKTNNTTKKHLINNKKKINDDITKIQLNTDDSERSIYKYKNMLGDYYKAKIPNGKRFDLKIKYENPNYGSDDAYGMSFTKDGLWHSCSNLNNCQCEKNDMFFITYKRKGNYIYEKNDDGDWALIYYIVDGGLFYPEYYKEED